MQGPYSHLELPLSSPAETEMNEKGDAPQGGDFPDPGANHTGDI